MTRVTKMARKRHEEASGFNVEPLLPPHRDQHPDSTAVAAVDDANSGQKRRAADDEPATSEQVGADVDDAGISENRPKKKKMRHRSKNDNAEMAEAPGGTDNAENGGTINTEQHGQKLLSKAEREALRRRTRREKLKEKKMTCFLCRNKGHSIKSCPKAEGNQSTAVVESDPAATDATAATSGICYKCGSSQHTSSKCTKLVDPKNPYPFAHCFVCNNKGHLAGQCEKNDRGLYPNGGSCKYCGSVRHFAKDCKPSNQEAGTTMLGKISLDQGGDDDDVFVALHKMSSDPTVQNPLEKPKKANPNLIPMAQKGSQRSVKAKANKKVVAF